MLVNALRRSGPNPGIASNLEANPFLPRLLTVCSDGKRCASSRMRGLGEPFANVHLTIGVLFRQEKFCLLLSKPTNAN